METVLGYVGIIVPALCTIVVAWITANAAKSKKAEDAEKQLEKERQTRREEELDGTLKKLGEKIDKIDGRITSLEDEMQRQREADNDMLEDLRKLADQHQINGEYIHALSQLITVLAEGMRDQHLDGNITNAVAVYRKFESEILNKLITRPVIED